MLGSKLNCPYNTEKGGICQVFSWQNMQILKFFRSIYFRFFFFERILSFSAQKGLILGLPPGLGVLWCLAGAGRFLGDRVCLGLKGG